MKEILAVQLSNHSTCGWRLIKSGQCIEQGSLEMHDLPGLSELFPNAEAHIFVPSEKVTALIATLPDNSRSSLDTIPYQVEENLIEPLEKYHIAFDPSTKYPAVEVLACSKQQMDEWFELIQQSGLQVELLTADYYLLPKLEEGVLYSDGGRHLIRTNTCSGVIPKEVLPTLDATDAIGADIESLLKGSMSIDSPLLSTYSGKCKAVNLLSGPYSPQKSLENLKQIIILPVAAALCACSLWLGLMFMQNHRLEVQLENNNLEMVKLYKSLYPSAKKIINPAAQMKANLAKVEQSDLGGYGFISQLDSLIALYPEWPFDAKSIQFNRSAQTLKIQITAKTFAPLEDLRERLRNRFTAASMSDLIQTDTGVFATITLLGSEVVRNG